MSSAHARSWMLRDGDSLPGGWPQELLQYGEVRRFDRREAIHSQGEAGSEIHLLLRGKVLRSRACQSGVATVLDVHARGSLVGVTSFLDGGHHPDTAQAHTSCVTLALRHQAFRTAIARHPRAARLLDGQIGRRYRHDAALAASLATERVETRIRALLVDLAERYAVHGDVRGMLLDLGLTRGELASLAGTTLETVVRTVNRLRDQGLLVTDGRRFFIPDLETLRP